MEGRDSKKEIEKFSNFQKFPKTLPKGSKHVLNMFGGDFSKNFLPNAPWRVETRKKFQKIKKTFKISKMFKNVPKSVQTCFEHV